MRMISTRAFLRGVGASSTIVFNAVGDGSFAYSFAAGNLFMFSCFSKIKPTLDDVHRTIVFQEQLKDVVMFNSFDFSKELVCTLSGYNSLVLHDATIGFGYFISEYSSLVLCDWRTGRVVFEGGHNFRDLRVRKQSDSSSLVVADCATSWLYLFDARCARSQFKLVNVHSVVRTGQRYMEIVAFRGDDVFFVTDDDEVQMCYCVDARTGVLVSEMAVPNPELGMYDFCVDDVGVFAYLSQCEATTPHVVCLS